MSTYSDFECERCGRHHTSLMSCETAPDMETPLATILRMRAEWDGEETLEQAVACVTNAPEGDVSITAEGVHLGARGWMSAEDLEALPARLRGAGYCV